MTGQLITQTRHKFSTILTLVLFLAGTAVFAQVPVDENGNPLSSYQLEGSGDAERAATMPGEYELLTTTELEELVGPIALYPDDLLAIVLPASAYPLEIVQAARFLEQLEKDSSLQPDEDWDDAVVALLNYPDIVRMMDEEIDWTWRLGEAVISQQNDVIAAVETFRDRAYAAGNLKSDKHQEVNIEEGIIEIVPVNEEIIHVPYYEPAEVVVQQVRPVYHYYPDPYPVYYYPYPVDYRFRSGYFWGVTTAFSIGWSNHYLHVWHPSYWGHPYYGRYYYGHYYRRPSITVYNNSYVRNSYRTPRYRHRDGDYWRPRQRAGSRPNEPRVVNRHYSPNRSRSPATTTVSSSSRYASGSRRNSQREIGNTRRDGDRTAATNTNRNRTTGSARDTQSQIRFRDRTNTNVITNRSGNTNRTGNSTRSASNRDRRTGPGNRNVTSTVRRETPTVRQPAPTTRAQTPVRRAAPAPRTTAPRSRQTAPAPRATAPSVRRTAPSMPRATAPAARRAPPAASRSESRSISRANSRGEPSTSNRRQSSSGNRRRSNEHD